MANRILGSHECAGGEFLNKKRGRRLNAGTADAVMVSEIVDKQIKDMWERIQSCEIDLSYACTHVRYSDGFPVYDGGLLVDLLTGYGYRIDAAMAFVSQFASLEDGSGNRPIVIISEKKSKIYSAIRPLKKVPR